MQKGIYFKVVSETALADGWDSSADVLLFSKTNKNR